MNYKWIPKRGLATLFMIMWLALSMIGCSNTNATQMDLDKTITEGNVSENGITEDNNILGNSISEDKVSENSTSENNVVEDMLTLHVIDVGQGSSTLISCEGKYMLIDGGDREYSSTVVSYLKKQGVATLDYVIATHYDSDHLNGIVGALSVFQVKQVIAPDYEATSRVYDSFVKKIAEKGIQKTLPVVGKTYSLGSATFTILSPNGEEYEDYNSYSVGIRLVHGENSFLLCGDATKESEKEILNNGEQLESDVYLVDHHGSSTSSLSEFVKAIDPQYAVISCGKDNEYGHPHVETLELLKEANIELYRTDMEGDIIGVSDGKQITWTTEHVPTEKEADQNAIYVDPVQLEEVGNVIKSEEIITSESTTQVNETLQAYVLNTNTKKFHLPNCNSVSDMKEANKLDFKGNRDEVIKMGYVPCKNCNP